MAGHAFAAEYNVTPWDGLLMAVRIAAGKVRYIEWVLAQARDDLELEGRFGRTEDGILLHPDTGEPLGAGQFRDLSWWVNQSAVWHDKLVRCSKMAVDAGVAERLVAQVELEARGIVRVCEAVLAALGDGVPEEVVVRARGVMRRELLAIGNERSPEVLEAEAREVATAPDGPLGDRGRKTGVVDPEPGSAGVEEV